MILRGIDTDVNEFSNKRKISGYIVLDIEREIKMAEKDRIRTEKFSVYLLPEERELLKKNAYEYNLTKSEYIRRLILAESLANCRWTMERDQAKQLLREISIIGNALSVIVYNTNAKGYADHEDWQGVKESYYDFLALVGRLARLGDQKIEKWELEAQTMLKEYGNNDILESGLPLDSTAH